MSVQGNRTAEYGTPENNDGRCIFCDKLTLYQMSLRRLSEQIVHRRHVCLSCAGAIKLMFVIEGAVTHLATARSLRREWARADEEPPPPKADSDHLPASSLCSSCGYPRNEHYGRGECP